MRIRGSTAILALVLPLVLAAGGAGAARAEKPGRHGSALEHIQIQVATRIEGRLLTLSREDDAIWIEYTRYYDGRRWRLVPYDAQFLVHARDAEMMSFFRSLPEGTMLRMTIFIDEAGTRRVVALEGT